MSDKKEKNLPPPSEEFMNVITSRSTNYINCEFCGREHFSTVRDFDWEEGELEKLIEENKKDPGKYFCP